MAEFPEIHTVIPEKERILLFEDPGHYPIPAITGAIFPVMGFRFLHEETDFDKLIAARQEYCDTCELSGDGCMGVRLLAVAIRARVYEQNRHVLAKCEPIKDKAPELIKILKEDRANRYK